MYDLEADRRAFFEVVFRPDITPNELVEFFLTYHGQIYDDQRMHFRQALQGAFARQGVVINPGAILSHDDRIADDFINLYMPTKQGRYFRTADLSAFQATPVLATTVNQYRIENVPSPPNLRISRPDRAWMSVYSGARGSLFVYPHGYQYFRRDQDTTWDAARSRAFSRDVLRHPKRVIRRPVVLIQDPYDGTNFAHFLFDWVPRLVYFLRAGLEVPAQCLFILGGRFGPFQRLLLDILMHRHGLTEENFLIPEGRMVLELEGPFHFFSDQKEVPLHPAHMAHPDSMAIIRELMPDIPAERGPHRRVFISRGDAKLRRLVNEGEVMRHLEPLGFTPVRLGEHNMAAQFAIMRGAEVVIGPHGMGFTFIAFHPGPLSVVELFHPRIGSDAYMFMSRALGFPYAYLVGDAVGDNEAGYRTDAEGVARLGRLLT